MSESTSLSIIAVCQLFLTAGVVVAALAIIYAIFAFKKMISTKIDEVMDKVQPVVDRVESIAQQAKETAEKVSVKVDSIMTKAESTADSVGNTVQSVSEKVNEAVSPKMAAAVGVAGTALKVMQLYQGISKIKQAHAPETKEPKAE
ncbi:MAG: hypothetical protein NT018_01945 [Armatimonadetes bacterium]|nr:hypothetical protein [Armatimonadota bacterium]